jgi:hypothetical protein
MLRLTDLAQPDAARDDPAAMLLSLAGGGMAPASGVPSCQGNERTAALTGLLRVRASIDRWHVR